MTMRFVRYDDVREFNARVLPALEAHEAENNLVIGILERGARRGTDGDWLMALIEGEGKDVILVALMTPPHNLLLAAADGATADTTAQALDVLVCALAEEGVALPGLLAEKALARAFAARYECRCGGAFRVEMEERVYALRDVADVKQVGYIRPADGRDLFYLPYWLKGFRDDAFGTSSELQLEEAQRHIEGGELYVLEVDGMPSCIAGVARHMPHGRSIGPVYTPPFLRGRGYATCCVAQLSRKQLDAGSEYCALFTDLSNPASNGAYMRVGYRPLCDFTQMHYEPR